MEQQHAEAFPKLYPEEERKPEKRKDNVLFFPQKEKEGAGEESGQGYEKYKALGGKLNPEQYQEALKRFADGRGVSANPMWSAHANSMARAAGITLSPEAVNLYGKLCAENLDPASEHHHDQELLAEALRFVGDASSLTAFIEKYPHIFKKETADN